MIGADPVTSRRDPEIERALLAALMVDRNASARAMEVGLTGDDFQEPIHGRVYDAIVSLVAADESLDVASVTAHVVTGRGDERQIQRFLTELASSAEHASAVGALAEHVANGSIRRRLIDVASEISKVARDQSTGPVEALDRAESMVFDIARHRIAHTVSPIRHLFDASLTRLEEQYERGDTSTGIATGFHGLDALLGGLQPANLIIVGGRPAMGKTSWVLGVAVHVAVEIQRPVLFFSLEMSHLELTHRVLSSQGHVDSTRMRNGKLAGGDWARISDTIGRVAEAPLYVDDNPRATVLEMQTKARRLKSKLGDLGVVVIDYLQLMTGASRSNTRQVEIDEITRGLKILARELECPVIAVSQVSRVLEMRADKRPMLADLRDGGSLEGHADVVIFLYRDEFYDTDSPARGTCELIVAKHRAGPTGVERLGFVGPYMLFGNIAPPA